MNIIKEKWLFLNATLDCASPQIKKLYQFGLQTIAAEQVVSLRANARLANLTWNTAKSKSYRLTKNPRVAAVFPPLVASFANLSSGDTVCVDFSDFGNGFQVLQFAKQTHQGRALPLYFEIIRYPIPEKSQNIFVERTIENFGLVFGCKPILVFDRGFASPWIAAFLLENQWKFVIRMKRGKFAIDPATGAIVPIGKQKLNDQPVVLYENILRLVTSDKAEGSTQPWYLTTNLIDPSREEIIKIYYHRFEIEEFFRDAKRLLGLEWVLWKTETSLAVTLWFVILGVWCLRHLISKLGDLAQRAREKMQLSETRYAFELLRTETYRIAEGRFLCVCDV
jgi:hypothetical protein